MDLEDILGNPDEEQNAAIIAALRQQQGQEEQERAGLQKSLGRQQGQAGALRALNLLTSMGSNPLLAGIQRASGEQGGQLEGLAARTEQRIAGLGANPLAAIRAQQAQERLRQFAQGLKARDAAAATQREFQAGQNALNRTSRERAAAIIAGDKATQDQLNNEAKLRGEIAGNKVIQEEQAAAVAFDKVQRAAADASPAGDLALIFGYMKTLDPSSAVREGEFANAQNAAGIPERIRNAYNRVMSGERLNPAQRAEFVRSAKSQYGAVKQRADAIREGYKGVAAKSGVQTERVIVPGVTTPDISLDDTSATMPAGAQKPAKVQYSPSRNKTRELDATGKVIREYEGKPHG